MSGHPALSMRHVSDPSAAFFAQVNALRHRIFRPAIRRDVSGSRARRPRRRPRAPREGNRGTTRVQRIPGEIFARVPRHVTARAAQRLHGGAAANAVGDRGIPPCTCAITNTLAVRRPHRSRGGILLAFRGTSSSSRTRRETTQTRSIAVPQGFRVPDATGAARVLYRREIRERARGGNAPSPPTPSFTTARRRIS